MVETVAGIIYLACRDNKIPRTLEDISEVTQVDKKEIVKTYKLLARKLEMNPPVVTIYDYIIRFATELHIPEYMHKEAIKLAKQAVEFGFANGRCPKGLISAILYLVCEKNEYPIIQDEIVRVTKSTTVTLRARKRELIKKLEGEN